MLGLAAAAACGTGVAVAHASNARVAAATPRCERRELRLSRPQTNGAAGTRSLIFTFTNRGSATCSLFGYPGMRILNKHRRRMPTTVTRVTAPEHSVLMTPGAKSSFLARYSDVPTGSEKCPRSAYVAVWPPNDFKTLTVALDATICGGRIRVWPVVAGVQHF
jgi:hypothetical protein